MNWLKAFVVGVVVLLGSGSGGVARAQDSGWLIREFASDIEITQSGSVVVEERIGVDFGGLAKHGIFRDLPVAYQDADGEVTHTEISVQEVLQDGREAEAEVSRNATGMRIRIGDPGATVSGEHVYLIRYEVVGILQSFEEFDELAWNVTGNGWEVPIGRVVARVDVPARVLQAACYEGLAGSRDACLSIEYSEQQVVAEAADLHGGEGMTVAVAYEPGVIPILQVEAPPTPADTLLQPVTGVAALAVFLVGSWYVVWRWWRYGRDRYWQRSHLPGVSSAARGEKSLEKILPLGRKQAVAVEYEAPDGLRPAEIGVLMDEKADTLDVSASIVDLAARGYLTITEVPKKWLFGSTDYVFTRTEQRGDSLLPFEKELLEALFEQEDEVKMSDLEQKFYKDLASIRSLLYEEVMRKKLFARRPDRTRVAFAAIAAGVIAGGVLLLSGGLVIQSALLAGTGLGGGAVGLLSLVMAPFMPRKTALGRELYERSRGYELFVAGTEKYRAKWLEEQGLFERVLPYAVMFGVTDKLAKALAELGVEVPEPSWYRGAGAFDVVRFGGSMEGFSQSLSTAIASRPSSSSSGGGGFSGGGFGGGGGGSW